MTVPRPAIWLLALALVLSPAAWAVEPGEMLKDPVLESRARVISKVLRCLVCQNQSIDDSNATLARDLRVLVRERLTAGDSDDQVVGFIVDRYGDFVLLDPPFKASTWLLWLGPGLLFAAGIGSTVVWFRRRRGVVETRRPLDADEERRLAALLDDGGDRNA